MQHTPYTLQVLDALMAAQIGIGTLLFALLWFHGVGGDRPEPRTVLSDRRRRTLCRLDAAAFVLLAVALVLACTTFAAPDLLRGLGATLAPDFYFRLCEVAGVLGTCAALCTRRVVAVAWSLAAEVVLYRLPNWFPKSDGEIVSLYVVWIGLLCYLLRPRVRSSTVGRPPDAEILERAPASAALIPIHLAADVAAISVAVADAPVLSTRSGADRDAHGEAARQDLLLFIAATFAAVVVCWFVLVRRGGSADEWAYTWQSAVFAHGRAYAPMPPCGNALQTFYVFTSMGRAFSQYTPGWPLLMAPFTALRAPWLAAPVMSGLLAVGMGRLARRSAHALRTHVHALPYAVVPHAGWIGGLGATLGTTYLLNAGSRYAHVPTMALFVWSIEATCRLIDGHDARPAAEPRDPAERRRDDLIWGLVLGATVALAGATRPSDGACLELPVGVLFLFAVLRKQITLRAFVASAVSLVALGGLCLVILRLQLGTWFTTGYSLNTIIYPWNVVRYDMPRSDEWKYALPVATGAYCWFPCSIAVGLVGLVGLRGAGARIGWAMIGVLPLLALYSVVDTGSRGRDWGYGPRYALVVVVPLALGMANALAPLAAAASQRIADLRLPGASAFGAGGVGRRGGPWALALGAMLVGTLRIVPLIWPGIHSFVLSHGKVALGIQREGIHHAVVFVGADTSEWDVLDETENMPFKFYPKQDVVVAIDRNDANLTECVKDQFPGRSYYRAHRGAVDITLSPF